MFEKLSQNQGRGIFHGKFYHDFKQPSESHSISGAPISGAPISGISWSSHLKFSSTPVYKKIIHFIQNEICFAW